MSIKEINSWVKDIFKTILIVGFITFIFWLIIESYNVVRDYVIENQCDLTGNVHVDPYVNCDSQGSCYYYEDESYEYFCNATNETKWFMYKIDRDKIN